MRIRVKPLPNFRAVCWVSLAPDVPRLLTWKEAQYLSGQLGEIQDLETAIAAILVDNEGHFRPAADEEQVSFLELWLNSPESFQELLDRIPSLSDVLSHRLVVQCNHITWIPDEQHTARICRLEWFVKSNCWSESVETGRLSIRSGFYTTQQVRELLGIE